MFKLIPHFLSPVTPSGKFSHSSAGYELDVCACVSQPFLFIVDLLPLIFFPLLGEYVYKHSLYYRPGTYFVLWIWTCSVSAFWDALVIVPCWAKRQFTKERIHDGRMSERKRSSLQFSRGQGARRRNEIEGFYYVRWVPIHWINSRGRPIRGGPPGHGLVEALTTSHRKILPCYKTLINAWDMDWSCGTK